MRCQFWTLFTGDDMTPEQEASVRGAIELICAAKDCDMDSIRQQAEALRLMNEAITTIRAALAEPVQEPKPVEDTLWPVWNTGPTNKDYEDAMRIQRLNQIVSPQRKPLTLPQIHDLHWPDDVAFEDILEFTRAIEAAHGIKENT